MLISAINEEYQVSQKIELEQQQINLQINLQDFRIRYKVDAYFSYCN